MLMVMLNRLQWTRSLAERNRNLVALWSGWYCRVPGKRLLRAVHHRCADAATVITLSI